MRVISGRAKSLKLKTITGDSTRPTTDRIKETLFNIINPYIYGCKFLDLFSGSGGIGIEALSRGAEHCTFVEKNPKAVECIKENLSFTKLGTNAEVIKCDFIEYLTENKDSSHNFDIIFMDPPYNNGFETRALSLLAGSGMINEDTLIIVECSLKTDVACMKQLGYTIVRRKDYKTNSHVFLRMDK